MRKLILLVGLTIGFILGSRAGREQYDQLMNKVEGLRKNSEVNEIVEIIQGEVHQRSEDLNSALKSKLSSTKNSKPTKDSSRSSRPNQHRRPRQAGAA
jgi:hypothetical protein